MCPDSKLLALCHNCVSRGFQGTGSTSLAPRFSRLALCSVFYILIHTEKRGEDSEKALKIRKPFQYSPQTKWESAVRNQLCREGNKGKLNSPICGLS